MMLTLLKGVFKLKRPINKTLFGIFYEPSIVVWNYLKSVLSELNMAHYNSAEIHPWAFIVFYLSGIRFGSPEIILLIGALPKDMSDEVHDYVTSMDFSLIKLSEKCVCMT